MIKALIIIIVVAYFTGGIFIFRSWYTFYKEYHEYNYDPLLVKIIAVGLIGAGVPVVLFVLLKKLAKIVEEWLKKVTRW